jgi:hypothetical protein
MTPPLRFIFQRLAVYFQEAVPPAVTALLELDEWGSFATAKTLLLLAPYLSRVGIESVFQRLAQEIEVAGIALFSTILRYGRDLPKFRLKQLSDHLAAVLPESMPIHICLSAVSGYAAGIEKTGKSVN